MTGCLRALSGRDDLVQGLLDSQLGQRWQRIAIEGPWLDLTQELSSALLKSCVRTAARAGECRVVLALPEIQRYLIAKCQIARTTHTFATCLRSHSRLVPQGVVSRSTPKAPCPLRRADSGPLIR
jgi:hypothetical protein